MIEINMNILQQMLTSQAFLLSLGYGLAVAILLGSKLEVKNFIYWFLVALSYLVFQEFVRLSWFLDQGILYTGRTSFLALITFLVYSLGLLLGKLTVMLAITREKKLANGN